MKLPAILIDSNVLIYCLRQNTKIGFLNLLQQFLAEDIPLAISHISIFEILAGSRLKEIKSHTSFLQKFPVIPLNADASVVAAKWYRKYRKSGATLSIGDLLIAGISITNKTQLLTLNKKHFPMFKSKKQYQIKNSSVFLLMYR